MRWCVRGLVAAGIICLLLILEVRDVQADVAEEFQRLCKQCDKQCQAGKYDQAEETASQMLRISEGPPRNEPLIAVAFYRKGMVLILQHRNREAERPLRQCLTLLEKGLGPDSLEVANVLETLARTYCGDNRCGDAEPLLKRALSIREKAHGKEHSDVANMLCRMGSTYHDGGEYGKAEAVQRRALTILEKSLGQDHIEVATCLGNLSATLWRRGDFDEAETLDKRALAIREKQLGAEHPSVATVLNNLAAIYADVGRFAEAEALYKRALSIREKVSDPDHSALVSSLNNLAVLYKEQGRLAESEAFYRKCLVISRKANGGMTPQVAALLSNLASVCQSQNRMAEAESFYKQAITVAENVSGPSHPDMAAILSGLGKLYCCGLDRPKDAEPLFRRALEINEKALGPEHPLVAMSVNNLAHVYQHLGRYTEMLPLYRRALAITEKTLGPDHPNVAMTLGNLANEYSRQGNYREAEELLNREISILEKIGASPDALYRAYLKRARMAWKAGRRSEAVADLRQAMSRAEQIRLQSFGAEHEHAEVFAQCREAFEQMVQWQIELGDLNEIINAAERSLARSLLDELMLAGANLHVSRSALEAEDVRERERALQGQITVLEKQLGAMVANGRKPNEENDREADKLRSALVEARTALYEHYRSVRSSSPVYQNLLTCGSGPPRVSQLQRQLIGEKGLLLVYYLGDYGGYCTVIAPEKEPQTMVVILGIDEAAAQVLKCKPGPLTAARLGSLLVNRDGTGLLQRLRAPDAAGKTQENLAVLWRLLVPEPLQKLITSGKVMRLTIVPDGPLCLLPFETLVVKQGKEPTYLLDVSPPIHYGPSATVLYNLVERRKTEGGVEREPVLTVGNPTYSAPAIQVASADKGVLEQLTARSRYGAVGGKLAELPYTDWELNWVGESFAKSNVKSLRLIGAQATEANVRAQVPGRRIVHLACHGLADQTYGNFFGALALTPGPDPNNPINDGFLTLPEIYELNLKGCELTILSACETNYGPQQRGEGVWALSRGFLVAGSRRVVASNWLVDDEAAASLISYFCAGIAQAEKAGKQPDYAQALHEAKRWVRRQEKWKSPYYWGTFVLVGPN
jgi:CHAT domain-containing protein/tetratricopeptide (TPR) repeat protein